MNWKQLKSEINWDAVSEKILETQGESITQERFNLANKLVLSASEYYLPLDLKYFKILEVEKPYLHTFPSATLPDKGIIDVVMEIREDAGKPYNDRAGQKILIDWKSTSSDLDTTWRNRYIPSWQWKRYAAQEDAALFEYRGVSTKTYWNGQEFKQTCGPLILQIPADNYQNVVTDFLATEQMKLSLAAFEIYPRNAPSACYKFGEYCPHQEDCQNSTMPPGVITAPHASYSSDETFKLCPEKYRRQKLANSKIDDFESPSFLGTMFHRGIAEVYTQMKEKQ